MGLKIHTTEIKVRYAETDNMGIVYYANYLVWFEVGRTEYLLAEGMDYRDVEREGLFMAVVEAHGVYKAPARYGETVVVHTWPSDIKNSSMKFHYKITRKDNGKLLCEGYTSHVLIDKELRPHKIPENLKKLLT
ncbi:MAG: thioesterase family protein [Candidatus Omnitrophica bacterium]|nr:thioesterase family protein [Candidatus Omnitrophota bacterium]MDD5574419.1 thioesterase family protein [Candidatus Omnitrophota bacterium]